MPERAGPSPGATESSEDADSSIDGRIAAGLVLAITLIGLVPRLLHLDNTFLGDELSTLFIINGNDLGGVLDVVRSPAEISPPLYFLLADLFSRLGSAPELARIPALIAGIASIPLTYAVGARAIGRRAGLIAAAAMALNPFMVFYATDSRAYTVAISLLLVSTLAMLLAVQTRRWGWWVLYGVATCLCMYAHYTTAFVLGAQLLWLLWAHREAWKPAILANAAAVIAYLPWIPGLLDDFDSPTIEILSDLQGDGLDVKLEAFGAWSFGYPFNRTDQVPGDLLLAVGVAALAVALVASLIRWAGRLREKQRGRRRGRRPAELHKREAGGRGAPPAAPPAYGLGTVEPKGVPLVLMLMIATPLAEMALLLAGGSDLLGARNLNTAAGGFALTIGAITTTAGPVLGAACVAAVLGVFAFGTVKSTEATTSTIDFRSAAAEIEANAGPDDIVVDMLSPVLAPVPLTPIDAHLPQTREEYRLYLTEGPPPFLSFPPPGEPILEEAFEAARGKTVFLVAGENVVGEDASGKVTLVVQPSDPSSSPSEFVLPRGSRVVDMWSYEGLGPVELYEIAVGG